MHEQVDDVLARLVARGGEPFREIPQESGLLATLRRLLGLPARTHCYERLDGSRVLLTSDEASEIPPIELEMLSLKTARRMMRERRDLKVF